MDFLRIVSIVLASVLGLSNCAYVDELSNHKCHLDDKACQAQLIAKVLKDISGIGIPEYDIPPIDPMDLKDLNVKILDILDFTLADGVAKGVKDCSVQKFNVNIEKLHASIEITCDVVVKGKYKMASSTPIFKNLFGGDIHGEGNGKVKIEQINIKISFPFEVQKRGDDTFLTSELAKFKYTFDILKKVTFNADNLYIGDRESSKEVIPLINDNWKVMVDSFGSKFLDVAIEVVFKFLRKFFDNVPTKYYLIEDLSSYAH